MASQSLYPSTSSNMSICTTRCQRCAFNEIDVKRADEIDQDVARRLIPNHPDLVQKVTRVLSIGNYSGIAEDLKALGHVEHPDPNSLHQRLYRKVKCEAFLEYEESKSNQKQHTFSTSQTSDEPNPAPGMVKNCSSKRTNPEESPSEPDPEPEVDIIQVHFWRCFGVVECKADYSNAQEQAEYGQLGWYASSALEAAFEWNTMWGWVVSKTTVRFVLFTHDAAVSSEASDMKDKSGHQIFIDNLIRLCLCSAYRAGFDPTKR
ncbi:hypothetical protein IWQ61_004141 [Dispira simplex]|nr:hypothetical protein IWQ61_004141 [Dispira simplex]